MPPARARSSRPSRPPRADDAPAAWADEDAEAPFAALVDAAIEARELDVRDVADSLGLGTAAFRAGLAAPSRLPGATLDRLALVLGVDRGALRAAARATPDAHATETADGGTDEPPMEDSPDAPLADGTPDRRPSGGADDGADDGAATRAPIATPEPPASPPALPAAPRGEPATLSADVERTIAAVADDALGRRIRLAILATVQTAAAEIGRVVPPELHELRRRVQRGQVPWVGEGAVVLDERGAGADDALLADAHRLVLDVRRAHAGYADLFAPVDDDALGDLLRRLTVAERAGALGATSACVVTPPVFGRYLLVCSADATADQRRLARRRALAHVLAGHVGDLAPLPHPAPPAAERLADLVALADLVPFWQLDDLRRQARLGWRAVTAAVARTARALAGDWPDERAEDRAMLRVRLYRAYRV